MRKELIGLGVLCTFTIFSPDLPAQVRAEIVACKDIPAPISLPYVKYGINISDDERWECEAAVDAKSSKIHMVRWKNEIEGKKIGFIDVPFRKEGDHRSVEEIIKEYSMIFLSETPGDDELSASYHVYRDDIKGIMYGKDSRKIAIYSESKKTNTDNGEEKKDVIVFIFQKDSDHYLNIGCHGTCGLQEVLSSIVIPALLK